MTREENKQAVVVGATGAMGQVIVQRLINEGWIVIAVARHREALAALEAKSEKIRPCRHKAPARFDIVAHSFVLHVIQTCRIR